ncbi:UNVERIFIED_CONTAM: hypothetical protein Slati_1121500 [Sesamum latifolium]|uniref:DUF4283 domain-containing protein n=1 Tax=Sesamum latifolium TaxID=2727402 RepID=A0AAW2XCB6_9LAMI
MLFYPKYALTVKGMNIKQHNEGRFLLRFNHVIDKQRAMEGRPWRFEKKLLTFNIIGEYERPMHVLLEECDFYVHVYDLLLSMMNLGVASLIGNRIGSFQDLEVDNSGCSWGASLRIRVGLNVSKPLKTVLKDILTNTVRSELGFRELIDATPYGPWLRAPAPEGGDTVREEVESSSLAVAGGDGVDTEMVQATNPGLIQPCAQDCISVRGSAGDVVVQTRVLGVDQGKGTEGLGRPWTVQTLKGLIQLHRPGLIFLSEIKCKARRGDNIKSLVNYNGVGVDSMGKSGGLLFLWRKDVELWLQSFSSYHIDVTVKSDECPDRWHFTGFYGYPEDIGFEGIIFTWCNRKEEPHTVRARLDRVCSNSRRANLFSKAKVHHEAVSCSDHSVVLADLEGEQTRCRPRQRRRFRFEAAWISSSVCSDVIQQA